MDNISKVKRVSGRNFNWFIRGFRLHEDDPRLIDFGTNSSGLSLSDKLSPAEARELGQALIDAAETAEGLSQQEIDFAKAHPNE